MQQLGWTGPGSIGYDGRGSPPMVRNPPPGLPIAPTFSGQTRTRGERDEPQSGRRRHPTDGVSIFNRSLPSIIRRCEYLRKRSHTPPSGFSHATVGVRPFSHTPPSGYPKFSHATVGVMFSHATVGVGGYRVSFAVSVIREAGAGRTMRSRESQSAKKPRDGNGRLRKSGS